MQTALHAEMMARRPATPKNPMGWTLIRRAALEGGVTVWTPNLQAATGHQNGPQPGVWTTIGLLGDITTYYTPGTPDSLIDQHFAKVRQAAARMTRFSTIILTLSGTIFWVLHPATLLINASEWLSVSATPELPDLGIGMLGLSVAMEVLRRVAIWRIRRWLP
jgi:hypothetical protein